MLTLHFKLIPFLVISTTSQSVKFSNTVKTVTFLGHYGTRMKNTFSDIVESVDKFMPQATI